MSVKVEVDIDAHGKIVRDRARRLHLTRLRKINAAVNLLENTLLKVNPASKLNEAFRELYYLARLAKKAK